MEQVKQSETVFFGHGSYNSKDWTIYKFQYWNESLAHAAELFLETCPQKAHDPGDLRVERVSKWLWNHKTYKFKSGHMGSRIGPVQNIWSRF